MATTAGSNGRTRMPCRAALLGAHLEHGRLILRVRTWDGGSVMTLQCVADEAALEELQEAAADYLVARYTGDPELGVGD